MTQNKYEKLGKEVGRLVDEKQKAYGNSFGVSGEFLKLLYPEGIRPDQYLDALTLVRIFDKQKRIATDCDAFGESPYNDIAGYGLLGKALRDKPVRSYAPSDEVVDNFKVCTELQAETQGDVIALEELDKLMDNSDADAELNNPYAKLGVLHDDM